MEDGTVMLAALSIFTEPFMVHAFIAGTVVALVCGAVGSLLVLRSEVFTADALSHVAFTGAMAALVVGVALGVGLVIACVGAAMVLVLLGRRIGSSDATIGSVFAWVLGLGTLLLAIATTRGVDSTQGIAVLFGSILTISTSSVVSTVLFGVVALLALAILGRPLVFASIDRAVAEARGIPVLLISGVFAIVVALATAMAVQAVGALLFVGLIAAPAGAADRLTGNPYRAMVWSMGLATASVWSGLVITGLLPTIPAASAIIGVAAVVFCLTALMSNRRTHRAA
jgi:zinc/manganese transport system permease protein